jgi:hypothetical protein
MCQKCQLCKYTNTQRHKLTYIDKLNFQFTLGQISFPVFFFKPTVSYGNFQFKVKSRDKTIPIPCLINTMEQKEKTGC